MAIKSVTGTASVAQGLLISEGSSRLWRASSPAPASAYGLFTAAYGTAWVLGSVAIGLLFGTSLGAVTAFAVAAQLAAVPFLALVRTRARPRG